MMALQLRQVHIDERWVRSKAALEPGTKPEMVDSLTLQGTYSEKVVSLGESLKNFKNVRSLDLSRNLLVSLEGIECLKSLMQLNLYYNNIPTTTEVARLIHLPFLKELDLRLNPVTRNEHDYRLTVVHMLENLDTLDDRAVRESERHSAKMLFAEEETRRNPEQEANGDREPKPFIFDDKQSTKLISDGGLGAFDDHGKRSGTYSKMRNFSTLDPLKRARHSTSVNQHAEEEQAVQNELDDDYRSLPSPTRSSLRSPGKCPPSRSKEGCRVTFADNPSGSDFLVQPIMPITHEEPSSLTKRFCLTDADLPFPSHKFEPTDNPYSYLTSTPLQQDTFKVPGTYQRSRAFVDYGRRHPEDLKTTSSQFPHEELREPVDNPPLNRRLLDLSSDLYTATHVENKRLLSADHLSTLSQEFVFPSSKLCSASLENLFEKSLAPSMTTPRTLSPTRGKESSPNYLLNQAKSTKTAYDSLDVSVDEVGLKRTTSLTSLLSSKPPPARHRETKSVKAWSGDEESTLERRQSELGTPSPVAVILRQLLDLVDRYWNGSGSLLANQKFLSPARDLLSVLMTSPPAQYNFTHRLDNSFPSEESKPVSLKNSNSQNLSAQEETELLKEKLEKVLEENRTLQNQLQHMGVTATLNYSASNNVSPLCDDLKQRNEQLTRKVDHLNDQLKQFSKLQETVNLLQDSHRSLVSSNEYLLRQVNKTASSPYADSSQLNTGQTKTLDSYSPPPRSGSSPITTLYSSGAQFRKVNRLSACPL
ncbi:leucine-rich repeat-containing protein 36 isoform X2 [Ambystoma mexicanum]|uniref:leucine-rich repeat-containing protein 36 isoform X2 n=1 Tax=Ambystoma mexicanum TaxID=8296 RepID=UPI0037E71571